MIPTRSKRNERAARNDSRLRGARIRIQQNRLVVFVCLGIAPLCSGLLLSQERASRAQGTSVRANPEPASDTTDTAAAFVAAMQNVVVNAIEQAEPSVAAIARVRRRTTKDRDGEPIPLLAGVLSARPLRGQTLLPTDPSFVPNEFGAGVIVDSDGLILTTYHIIGDPGSSKYYVWIAGQPFPATVVAADPWYDLAILKIDRQDLQPIAFGEGGEVRKGQFVIVLGNPEAIAHDGRPSGRWSMVSNLLRRAPRDPARSSDALGRETLHHYGTLIQIDARLSFGFGGGALIDLDGRMVGLATSYTAGVEFSEAAGLVIPVDKHFRRVVAELKEGRKPEYGFLGVAPEPLSVELRQQGRQGAVVVRVLSGTPAARADIQVGDVISHLNEIPVIDDDDLIRLVSCRASESDVELTVIRDSEQPDRMQSFQSSVTLSKKAPGTLRVAIGTVEERGWRGMVVEHLTAVRDFESLPFDPMGCVYVQDVGPQTPSWSSGVRPGVFVSHVGNTRVSTPRQFYELVRNSRGDIRLRVRRGGQVETRTISP